MDQKTKQTLTCHAGKIDAYLVVEVGQDNGKATVNGYVEVYPHGEADPEQMIAWFGDVPSFTRWVGEAETTNF